MKAKKILAIPLTVLTFFSAVRVGAAGSAANPAGASGLGTWFAGTRPAGTDMALLIRKR